MKTALLLCTAFCTVFNPVMLLLDVFLLICVIFIVVSLLFIVVSLLLFCEALCNYVLKGAI